MDISIQKKIIRNPKETIALTRGIKDLFKDARGLIGENVIDSNLISHYEFLGENYSDTELSPLERLFYDMFYEIASTRYAGDNFEYQLGRAGIKNTTDMKKVTVNYINYMLKKRDIAIRKNSKHLKSKASIEVDIYYS